MKRILLGLIIGLLIGTAGTALASSDYIQAKFSEFNLRVNGSEVELDNQPLVVEGTTYWPIRELSEYLGFEIDYEGSTRTIVVETEVIALPIEESLKVVDEVNTADDVVTENAEEHGIEYIEYKILTLQKLISMYERSLESENSQGERRAEELRLKSEHETELEYWQGLKLESQ